MNFDQLLSVFIQYPVAFLGFAGMLVAAIRLQLVPADRTRTERMLVVFAFAYPVAILTNLATAWASTVTPKKLDLYLFQIDGVLGFQPAFVIGQFLRAHHWLYLFSGFIYNTALIWAPCLYIAYQWCRSDRQASAVLKTMIVNLVGGFPVYLAVPACGPVYAFPAFPYSVPDATAHSIALTAAPNCVPSIHFSSALLVLWYTRHWTVGRILGAVVVVSTFLATLGFGQHYLIDLVLAVPYAAVVYRLCNRSMRSTESQAAAAAVGTSRPSHVGATVGN